MQGHDADPPDSKLDRLRIRDPKSRVGIEIGSGAEFFVSDRELLTQLLYHVVDNAVKFSPHTKPVQIVADRSGDRLVIRILDRGPGIDRDLLESPDLFKQADRSSTRIRQGLGLGLVPRRGLLPSWGSVRYEPRAVGGTEAILDLEAPSTG
jgi:two-component system sensor histidine kinase KdpD